MEIETGKFSVSGDTIESVPGETTCPGPIERYPFKLTVSDDSLSVTTGSTILTFTRLRTAGLGSCVVPSPDEASAVRKVEVRVGHRPRNPGARLDVRRVVPAAEPDGDSFFLSSRAMRHRAHVPLAVIHGGQVADAVLRPARWPAQRPRGCGARDRWGVVGSRWRALDGWGQVLGEAVVMKREIYDVTRCAELRLSKVPGDSATTTYVSADSAWRASPPSAFTPPATAAASLGDLAAARIDDRALRGVAPHPECAAIGERTRFFVADGGRRYGVATSNVGYLVARLDGNSWTVVTSELTAPHKPDNYRCYRPVAVFDMNGDGTPEVVLRQSAGEVWGDLVVGRAPASDGTGESWRVAAISPGSALI